MIHVVGADRCTYCVLAKELLEDKQIAYTWESVDDNLVLRAEIKDKYRTVPQMWEDNSHIGGYDDLVKHLG